MLASFSRGIEYKRQEVILQLYTILARSCDLEYNIQIWLPQCMKNVEALERFCVHAVIDFRLLEFGFKIESSEY